MSEQALGPNEWLVEEMYEQYLANPASVSESWREFFADYQTHGAQPAAATPQPTAHTPAPEQPAAATEQPAAATEPPPQPAPAPAATPAPPPAPSTTPSSEPIQPLRGAAAR